MSHPQATHTRRRSMWVCHICRRFVSIDIECPKCGIAREEPAKTYCVEAEFSEDPGEFGIAESFGISDEVYDETFP